MALVRWDPLRDLENLSSRLSQLFGETRSNDDTATLFSWSPAVDVAEDEKEYVVKADLPEVKKEDVKVNIQDGLLVVEGERKQEKEEKGKKFHRIERSYGKFVRRLGVPSDVDATKVSAEYSDGVLRVHLPKAPTAKPASIDVKVG
jgi:HSP20 family protein